MYLDVGYYRYQGFDLKEKIGWAQQGAGPTVLGETARAVNGLGNDLIESEERLKSVLRDLGAEWEGSAASSAGAAMQRAALWSGDSGHVSQTAGTQVSAQGDTATHTKNSMPNESEIPAIDGWDKFKKGMSLGGKIGFGLDVQTSFDDKAAEKRALDQKVNELLQQHESASRSNVQAIEPVPEPPKITVESAPRDTSPPPPGSVNDWGRGSVDPTANTNIQPGGHIEPHQRGIVVPPPSGHDFSVDSRGSQTVDPQRVAPPPVTPNPVPTPTPAPGPVPPPGHQPPGLIGVPPVGAPPVGPPGSGRGPGVRPPNTPHGFGERFGRGTGTGRGGTTTGMPGGGARGGVPGGISGGGYGPGSPSGPGGPGAGNALGRGGMSGTGVPGEAVAAGRGGPAGAGRPGAGSLMQPAVAGRGGKGDEDGEHTDKYAKHTDEHFLDDIPLVAPPVLGEQPPPR
ncbi:hypothetical protein GCM10012275_40070 [Longimycelium tulufanense]|uniref:PPE domain-containing protein n=1 Tax=Longimycelium tulufanense TaxID=907463 RepID=A0A8J3CAL2_9PSEU|nr:hypothetical protein [Longimycelium tulufanense]GGM65494.1 hypothetical protein GCM10012275_40070 [Longimycelium tulufanense]